MSIKYTEEFLISELHRFVSENGRIPKSIDMKGKFGYPSYASYISHFGSWNNALMLVFSKINQTHFKLTNIEICAKCGCLKQNQWYYKDNQRLCARCYNNRDYMNKNLNPNSTVGFAFISQRVVAKALKLGLDYDCNCSEGFGAPYDLYDKKLGYINVKAATLGSNNIWYFHLKNKKVPDTYIMLGFSSDKSDILHVWITKPTDKLMFNKKSIRNIGIGITNDINNGLKRAAPWEVDCKPYNDAYHNMSLENCSILRSN